MDIIKGIEGNYIETKHDYLIFDVKGIFHPYERRICFLRFYPDSKGDRIRDGIKFKKIYDLNERYSFLRKNFPQYLFYSNELDLELQGVKNKDIKKIYTPRECLKELSKKEHFSKIEKYSIELCELFVNKGGVPVNSIGITGSIMVGLNKEDSDIDLIIYGTETSLKFQDKLKKILKESKNCRMYNLKEYKSHYNWRVGGSNITFEDFMKSERRKIHQGKFYGYEFFIRYIKSPQDWQGDFYDYRYKNYGRIKLKAEIVDSTDSIFTPCSYKIKVKKLLENNLISNKINVKDIHEINTFRGRFCEQAIKGENVLVEGKLEKVNFKNKEEYFRVLLSDKIQDKMIILNN